MLGKAFRPWRQLPDRSFADVAASLCATWRWGDLFGGSGVGCPSADLASCAQRPASAYIALGLGANIMLTFSLET